MGSIKHTEAYAEASGLLNLVNPLAISRNVTDHIWESAQIDSQAVSYIAKENGQSENTKWQTRFKLEGLEDIETTFDSNYDLEKYLKTTMDSIPKRIKIIVNMLEVYRDDEGMHKYFPTWMAYIDYYAQFLKS